jgi:hypothetical protein
MMDDGRVVIELKSIDALPCPTLVAFELFPGRGLAETYGLVAIGPERKVVAWLRAGEA